MIFRVNNGCFSYENGGRTVLNNISITVREARILAVLGPNGAGKTTLLKCMMGLLPWSSGTATIDDRDMRTMKQREIWKRIAYVPQAKGNPLSYTGEEMTVLGRSVHLGLIAQPKKEDYEKACRVMEQIGILHLRHKVCSQMSGGEFQMVLMARALVTDPDMLVLDEPESNLDFKNQLIVLSTMRKLVSEQGISCIFNTHYPDHALKIADDALLLGPDGMAKSGACSQVITSQNLRRAFGVDVEIGKLEAGGRHYTTVVPLEIL